MKFFDKIPLAFASFSSFISGDVRRKAGTLTRQHTSFVQPSSQIPKPPIQRSKSSLAEYKSDPFIDSSDKGLNDENFAKFLSEKKNELDSLNSQQPKIFDVEKTDDSKKYHSKRLKDIAELSSDGDSHPTLIKETSKLKKIIKALKRNQNARQST